MLGLITRTGEGTPPYMPNREVPMCGRSGFLHGNFAIEESIPVSNWGNTARNDHLAWWYKEKGDSFTVVRKLRRIQLCWGINSTA